ncbi:Hpt domain-containing protein [Pseudoxanthomonas sp.]|uniref:Hpt domain-containing protein n=1 Tax=Pseudoxanthomonas sp. TaxID=1871049 RepID=UPI00261BC88B|nr:Hpt domain-containing protein [Pseudoxanthomonas sp.]WDS37509.1 MAG: Hpt domain-containing protein [Pseudoxanthomonas sp.]
MSALREAMSHAVLGWVKPELDQTLRLVRDEIETFADNPADAARMQVCVGYLHQVQGTLHMVELYAPAMVAEELEKLAQALQDGQVGDANEACATLMRGTVLLPDYLERLQSGHRDIPIVLLPLLNDIRAARGEAGLSESVLFAPDLDRPLPQEVPAIEPMPGGTRDTRVAQAHEHLDRVLAAWPEDGAPLDATALASALMPLQRLAEHTAARRMLWVAVNVAEALRDGALAPTPALHQGFVGVLRAVRQIKQGVVPGAVLGQEPTRQLLYQVAQTTEAHPALDDLRNAFDLQDASPSPAEVEHARSSISGRNRALLDTVGGAVKEELMQVKDALDLQLRTNEAIAGLAPQVAQLGSIGDTLGMMGLGLARNVVLQQRDSLSELVDGRRAPDEGTLLDIAGALLYVDASLDDQVTHLGDAHSPDMQATDAQLTLEALAGEAIRNFAEARQQFVAFIETGWDHAQLHGMPRLLGEVGGALQMLELAEPADYVEGVRRYIVTELIGRRRVPGGAQLDTLADAMASLEYYLEALREHRPNRGEILGITRSSLEALRYWPLPSATEEGVLPDQDAFAVPTAAAPLAFESDSTHAVDGPVADAGLAIERGPVLPAFVAAPEAAGAFDPVASEFGDVQGDDAALIEAAFAQPAWTSELSEDVAMPVTVEAAQVPVVEDAADRVAPGNAGGQTLAAGFDLSGNDIDDEIRDVFLEEFDEEIDNLREMLPAWTSNLENLDRLRPIRRVFHTLKGSGRLVGARQLGEFAWKIENMLNRVLDGTRPATPAVVTLLEQATGTLPLLNAALRGRAGVQADLEGVEALAERLAAGEEAHYSPPGPSAQVADEPVESDAGSVAPAFVPDLAGTPASVDSVLREILETEVGNHLQTVDAWLEPALAAGTAMATDPLLRAFHTMNGAFAMADVPEITEVTGRAEQYVKRLMANGAQTDATGIATLAAASAAIRNVIAALQAEQPRIPLFSELRAQLGALCDDLPHIARLVSTVVDDRNQNTYTGQLPTGDFAPDLVPGVELTGAMDLSRFIDGQPAPEAPVEATADVGLDAAGVPALPEDGSTSWFDLQLEYRATPKWSESAAPGTDASITLGEPVASDLLADSSEQASDATGDGLPGTDAQEVHATHDAGIEVESIDADAVPLAAAADVDADTNAIEAQASEADAQPVETLVPFDDADADADVAMVVSDDAPVGSDDGDADVEDAAAPVDAAVPAPQADDVPTVADAASEVTFPEPVAPEAEPVQPSAQDGGVDLPPDHVPTEAPAMAEHMLDFSQVDRDLVDIFVEEGNDLLDHSDGLLARLREAPDDRNLVIGLQRDLHTIKGGARMAGVDAIGDLGHAIESLLEQVAEHRAEVDRGVIGLLERGFDVLHGMLARTAAYYLATPQPELVAEFDARARGETIATTGGQASDASADHAGQLGGIALVPPSEAAFETDGAPLETVAPGDGDTESAELVAADPLAEGDELSVLPVSGHSAETDESEFAFVAESDSLSEVSEPSSGEFLDEELLAALDAALTAPAHDTTEADAPEAMAFSDEVTPVEAAPVSFEVPVSTGSAASDTPTLDVEPTQPSAPVFVAPATVAAVVVPQPIAQLAPLSAPIDMQVAGDEEHSSLGTSQEQVRVRADLLDQLVNQAGEVAIYRARLEQQMGAFRSAMAELDRTNTRLHDQLRRLDLETEAQIVARYQREQDTRDTAFDPLELDRFSTLQQLSRALGESAADISGLQTVLDELARQNDGLLGQQSRVSSELQDGLMRARMVPFEGSVPRLRRVLRQAASDTGKQAQLQLEGAHGELDRNVLERMTAPLEHLLRNAVAHGLESPRARREAGKPEEGVVRVVLRREGSEMVLQVADDGAGIDHAAIRRRAEQRGMLQPGAELGQVDLERLILEPGFSTYEEVSQVAGRGVGMDVVHNEVRQLGGSLEITSARGQGTTFTLRLPQTLAVTQAVFVRSGETQFAVPVAAVSGIGRISRERFEAAGAVYVYADEDYALHDLGTLVGQDVTKAEGQSVVPLLLIRAGELRAAVAVDQVLGNREIVVKPVGPQIGSIPGIYGATITGDGSVVVILDAAPLVRRYIAQPALANTAAAVVEPRHVPLVMVVDDSLTMRKVTGRVLERHNFEVSTARDGVEALERLEERVPDLMLLDIEMPRMDGYELATAMKADPRFADVPIVMITSRTGDKHRQRALEIGVQRYMGKPYQELDLMRNVYDLLGIARVRD